jgi:hypothetical protein
MDIYTAPPPKKGSIYLPLIDFGLASFIPSNSAVLPPGHLMKGVVFE